ncbi:16S rRNA (cytosine(1402)-N(4))-methyltransferase, partial [Candidatus Berkelbacteria bacterium RBG_13_40_8]
LLGIEWDTNALEEAKSNLADFEERFQYYHGSFVDLGLVVRDWGAKEISGILMDLGPSTYQLTDESRGFTFQKDAPLDMRQDQNRKLSAADIVNKFSEKEIRRILFEGEEKFGRQIAKEIVEERAKKPIQTTRQLVEIIRKATPPSYRYDRKTHFATGTFRSLRMAVNSELENLQKVLPQAVSVLSPGGRIAIISFHSLEDRIVKQFFKACQDLEILTNKPIVASIEEIQKNPNARSAKLRGARRLCADY